MATIAEIKTKISNHLTNASGAGSITKTKHAEIENDIADKIGELTNPSAGTVGQVWKKTGAGTASWANDETGGGGGAVESVNGKTGAVTIAISDIAGLSTVQSNANSALQPGNNISQLTNDADYQTESNVDSKIVSTAVLPGDDISTLNNNLGYATTGYIDSAITNMSNISASGIDYIDPTWSGTPIAKMCLAPKIPGNYTDIGVNITANDYQKHSIIFYYNGTSWTVHRKPLTSDPIPITTGDTGYGYAMNVLLEPMESGSYSNLKLSDGSAATAIEITPGEVGVKYLFFDSVDNAWSKRTMPVTGYLKRINTVVTETTNLLNKEDLRSGGLNENGSSWTTSNWFHAMIDLTGGDYSGQKITISGWPVLGTDIVRFVYLNSSMTALGIKKSTLSTLTTDALPSGIAYLGIMGGNVLGIGTDPIGGEYRDVLMVNFGETALPYEPYARIKAESVIGLKSMVDAAVSGTISKEMYYELNSDGFSNSDASPVTSTQLLIVYVKVKDYYVGIHIAHEYNMSEIVYKDYWRIVRAHKYTYNGTAMTKVADDIIVLGESECVYQAQNRTYDKVDFTGGVHGDETVNKIKLIVDGKSVSLAGDIPLAPCTSIFYAIESSMHETADDISGTPTVVSGHPVECTHIKITEFKPGQYETFNRLVWQKDAPNFWYHGICCAGKNSAVSGFDEDFNETAFTGAATTKYYTDGNRRLSYYNSTNQMGIVVESFLTRKESDNDTCKLFTWDRSDDSKYYRKTPDNASTSVGEIYESKMVVKFI